MRTAADLEFSQIASHESRFCEREGTDLSRRAWTGWRTTGFDAPFQGVDFAFWLPDRPKTWNWSPAMGRFREWTHRGSGDDWRDLVFDRAITEKPDTSLVLSDRRTGLTRIMQRVTAGTSNRQPNLNRGTHDVD